MVTSCAARVAHAQSHPDSAVAARGADFESPLRSARDDQQPKKSSVLFGHGQLVLIGRFDLLQERVYMWRHVLCERTGRKRKHERKSEQRRLVS